MQCFNDFLKPPLRFLIYFLIVLFFSGCATIIHGSRQKIGIVAYPLGATAVIDGKEVVTPAVLDIERRRIPLISITSPSYETANIKMRRDSSHVVAGNILLGGIIGYIIDFSMGSAYVLSPDPVEVKLSPAKNYQETISTPRDQSSGEEVTALWDIEKTPRYSYVKILKKNGETLNGFIWSSYENYSGDKWVPVTWVVRNSMTSGKSVKLKHIAKVIRYPLSIYHMPDRHSGGIRPLFPRNNNEDNGITPLLPLDDHANQGITPLFK